LNKAPDAFRTISEVADELDLPQHVLRFWESRFPHVKPMKRGGGRRYYRPEDIDLLRGIRHLLYGDGYTIRGVQRILREQGVRTVQSVGQGQAVSLPASPRENAPNEDGEPNGAKGVLRFLPALFSGASGDAAGKVQERDEERDEEQEEEAEDEHDEECEDDRESDEPAPPLCPPQKRPMAEVSSVSALPASKAPPSPSRGLAARSSV